MKKLLALGLSLAMMASLSAVAFAAETPHTDGKGTYIQVETDGDQTGNTLDLVTKLDDTDPSVDDTYTVTIPADQSIEWGTSQMPNLAATISGQMLVDSQVTVESNVLSALTLNDTYQLPVTMTAVSVVADGEDLAAADVTSTTGGITAIDWAAAPVVGVYTGQVIYTATYVPGDGVVD